MGGLKLNLIIIADPMCMFILEVICINPNKIFLLPHMYVRTIVVQNSVFSILIDIYYVFIWVMFLMMWFSCILVYVEFAQYPGRLFSAFLLGIIRSDAGWFIIITNEGSEFIPPWISVSVP